MVVSYYNGEIERERGKVMSKIKIDFECNGDAKEFFNGIIQDYYYSVKNSEDKELATQYESLTYTIEEGK
jgi:hypothetical protein